MLFEIAGVLIILLLMCYLYGKLTIGRCYCSTCLVGKTVLITGGNAGIGYETALNMSSRGCRLIIADKDDAESSKNKIIALTNNANIVVKHLDLSSFDSIRKFAKEINETEPRLDILINNAGIGASRIEKTKDGLDPVMQVNYYGPVLLTYLLLDLLKKSSPSRIIFTSSLAASFHTYNKNHPSQFTEKPNFTEFLRVFFTYANSKLLNIIAAKKFAEKLRDIGISCYSVYPGIVRTGIFDRALGAITGPTIPARLFKYFCLIFGKNVKDGIQTTVHLAVSKDLDNLTGRYFWDCKPFYEPFLAKDKEFCENAWKFSMEAVGLNPEEKL